MMAPIKQHSIDPYKNNYNQQKSHEGWKLPNTKNPKILTLTKTAM